jgi:acyl phosphate:glycerol-3-phosphate acyltransferase
LLSGTILVIASYLLGSVPTGLLLGKALGVDIRATGSGNIGATNVYRTLGRSVGIITLVGDCIKGLIPVLAARWLGLPDIWVAAAGFAAFFGHVYTIFLCFKGGKGVATALGVFLGTAPLAVLVAFGVFVIVLWKWRYVSLASMSAAAAMPLLVAAMDRRPLFISMTLLIAIMVVWNHRENIRRLKAGSENRFKA